MAPALIVVMLPVASACALAAINGIVIMPVPLPVTGALSICPRLFAWWSCLEEGGRGTGGDGLRDEVSLRW